MDNLPKDPPNSGTPPAFGSNFDPHTNPVDPNNPYSSQPPISPPNPPNIPNLPNYPDNNPEGIKHEHYSEVAQHKPRDEHGHFIHSNTSTPQAPPTIPIPPNPPNTSILPPIIEINQNTEASSKKDPPLFGFFITNPVTYLRKFLDKLIKRQAITIKIPVLAVLMLAIGLGGFGLGFQSGINWSLGILFPNYSPLLHRSISEQGIIQKSSNGGFILQGSDKKKTLWTLKSASANVNLLDFVGKSVQVKGNLTPTPNLIEVSEVISFDSAQPSY